MTDALIEASGSSLEEAFANAGLAVIDTMVDLRAVESKEERAISASGRDLETLLFNWLDSVLLLFLVDRFVAGRIDIAMDKDNLEFHLNATVHGEPFHLEKHGYRVEVKGVTFHEMKVSEGADGVKLQFMLDL